MEDPVRSPLRRLFWEYVVVVLGVLTALGVDQWNTRRTEEDLARYYLEGIAQDLDQMERLSAMGQQRSHQATAAAMRLLQWAEGGSSPEDPEEFRAVLLRSAQGFPIPGESIAWDEMMANGHLRLFRDLSFRRELLTVMGTVSGSGRLADQAREMGNTRLRGSGIYRLLPAEYWSGDASELSPAALQRGLALLRGSDELRMVLEDLVAQERRKRSFLESVAGGVADARAVVARGLGALE